MACWPLPRRSLGILYQGSVTEHHARAPALPIPPPPMPVCAVSAGWPESMRREFFACRTERDRHAWAEKWARVLDGTALHDELALQRRRADRRHSRPHHG